MARQRVKQKIKRTTAKKWGVSSVTTVTIKGAGGDYVQWRMPYYVPVPVEVGGEFVGWERKRRAAASSVSPEDAIAKARAAQEQGEKAEEAYWYQEGVRLGRVQPVEPEDQKDVAPRRVSLIDAALEMARGNVRYVDGRVEGHRHSYEEKQTNYCNHLLSSGLSSKSMDRLTMVEVRDWFISFMRTHAETTSSRFKSWLIQVGDWGLVNKYWNVNLFKRLPKLQPRVSEASKRIYSHQEIDAMWNAAITPQQKALLVLLRLGLRQGECLALDEDMVGDEYIEVKYTLTEHRNQWGDLSAKGVETTNVHYLGRPKTSASCARIHVPKAWMQHLKLALKCARDSGVRAYDDGTQGPITRKFVVSNRFGLRWEEGSASAALKNLMHRAGVEVGDNDSTFHAWRHTYCSDLCALKPDDITLAHLMRHRDVNLSKKVYAAPRHQQGLYRKYSRRISHTNDFNEVICKMDEDRRRASPPAREAYEATIEDRRAA